VIEFLDIVHRSILITKVSGTGDRDWLYGLALAEQDIYVRMATESDLRNFILIKKGVMENFQNVNHCTNIPSSYILDIHFPSIFHLRSSFILYEYISENVESYFRISKLFQKSKVFFTKIVTHLWSSGCTRPDGFTMLTFPRDENRIRSLFSRDGSGKTTQLTL
jgi:hypothetical protein